MYNLNRKSLNSIVDVHEHYEREGFLMFSSALVQELFLWHVLSI